MKEIKQAARNLYCRDDLLFNVFYNEFAMNDTTLKGKTILVIDDDIHLCQILDITFTVEGASVLTATDGRDGLQKFFAHRPDLIVLDVNMPQMNGWDTCRQIRLLSDVPIIMLRHAPVLFCAGWIKRPYLPITQLPAYKHHQHESSIDCPPDRAAGWRRLRETQ